mmetsp:Transcript_10452/g.16193  ORF Transcript_10452/g.16193 Transcript_10452/m.16193 type:complete len:113 (+) Transcript_10452:99-437(+)
MGLSKWLHPLTAQKTEDGTYDPSPFTLALGTSTKTSYIAQNYETKYTASKPILVVCTDDGRMKMKNDKVFNTGNHPIEMFLPLSAAALSFWRCGHTQLKMSMSRAFMRVFSR